MHFKLIMECWVPQDDLIVDEPTFVIRPSTMGC
jgi:hypothetical protein